MCSQDFPNEWLQACMLVRQHSLLDEICPLHSGPTADQDSDFFITFHMAALLYILKVISLILTSAKHIILTCLLTKTLIKQRWNSIETSYPNLQLQVIVKT